MGVAAIAATEFEYPAVRRNRSEEGVEPRAGGAGDMSGVDGGMFSVKTQRRIVGQGYVP